MSVLSNDRNITGTTKLERIGERAKCDKDTVFNNLGHVLDRALLTEVYHQMDRKKAVGIDGVTKEAFGRRLDENIDHLIQRIRKGTYRSRPSRLVEIPKEDGSKRPLAISCFEDKLVQAAVSKILTQIYEPTFLPCSYGFRPAVSCHDALKALRRHAYPCWDGAVVEIDIRKYFNSIPHKELMTILQKKITDERFLRLIDVLITTPTVGKGITQSNVEGCPQGSILSPLLANVYLHEVIDVWFKEIGQKCFKGKAEEVRYADDMVFVFEHYSEAKRFFEVLPKRLKKFGLELHMDKSQLIRSGQNVAAAMHRQGRRLPTYKFLGFTVYWGKARNGKWFRMKFKTRRDRFSAKLQGLKAFLGKRLTDDTAETLKSVVRVVRGWVNYFRVSDNEPSVRQFVRLSSQILRKWMNRRGRKRPINWVKFNRLLERINYPFKWKTISLFA